MRRPEDRPTMRGRIRIGTSGWNYPHWRGRFYPEGQNPTDWFATYAGTFDTVEINNTFYHQPSAATIESWRRQAPSGFEYAVKAHRYITHQKKLKGPEAPLERFFETVRRLGPTLGPVLYQLPPNWNPNLDRLDLFLRQLPRDLVHVVEFRNRGWLGDEAYAILERHGVSLCVHDLLPRHPRRAIGPVAYVRLHGAGSRYGGRYPGRRLESWAGWIREAAADRDVDVYFNNDQDAHAVFDAIRLRKLVEGG